MGLDIQDGISEGVVDTLQNIVLHFLLDRLIQIDVAFHVIVCEEHGDILTGHDVLHGLCIDHPLENCGLQYLLAEEALLHSSRRNKPIYVHGFGLPIAIRPKHGLQIFCWIPAYIQDNDTTGSYQVDANASSLCGHQSQLERVFRVVKPGGKRLSLFSRHFPFNPEEVFAHLPLWPIARVAARLLVLHQERLQHVESLDGLGEDDHLLIQG
mmetsp:Transcript_33688/g.54599  ORF Transcript_33688/g.54599 Transcript_33688/m.54599 type:complete len:211 (-) Transcript_33688:1568-2200(-)